MDKKINILFLDHQAEMGGGEFSLLTLIKELNKEVFTPIVVLGTVGPFKDKLDASGINTKIIKVPDYFRRYKRDPSRKNNFFSLIKSLFILHKLVKKTEKIIKKNKAKVIVINTVKSAFFGIPAARRAAIKSVWVIRDCLSKDYYRKAFLRSIKSLSRKAGKIICTSQEVKAHLVKLAGNDLEDKINIVYNGADLNRFNPSLKGESVKKELLLQDKHIISLIGRLEPWKGQKVFIRAAQIIFEKREDLRFLVVGGPLFGREKYEKECHILVKELALEGKVLFLGFRDDIPDIIAASDIIVHTSILPEPFGRDIIEAMACAKPVISTNIGGPAEIISSETGILIEPGKPELLADEIIKLINDPDKMILLGKEARKRIEEKFDIRKTTAQIENILKDMV